MEQIAGTWTDMKKNMLQLKRTKTNPHHPLSAQGQCAYQNQLQSQSE
jgi:hypothetical protein